MSEIWRDIPGYEGLYQVSDLGRVKSLPRVTTRGERSGKLISQRIGGRVLKPSVNTRGYLSVVLSDAGEKGRDLAKEFGVCESNISAIKHRRTFAWLE